MGLIDFIYPRVCHLCGGNLTKDERYICTACLAKLPRTCYHLNHDNPVSRRFFAQFRFREATSVFFYSRDSAMAELMQDVKYRGFRGLGRYLGELAARELYPTGFFNDIEAIVPVPMHFMKRARRGYNQVDEIAAGISKLTGVPVIKCLSAVRSHRTQTSLTRDERLKNTAGIFYVRHPEKVTAGNFLILDDVCTTGATLISASQAMLEAFPDANISILTLASGF